MTEPRLIAAGRAGTAEIARREALPLAQVLRLLFQRVTAAAERGDRITGYEDVAMASSIATLAVEVASPRITTPEGPGEAQYAPGLGVVIFLRDMPREQLAMHMVCSQGGVDLGRLREGFFQPEDWPKLTESAAYLSSLPIWIDDTPALGIVSLSEKVREIEAAWNREGTSTAVARKVALILLDRSPP